MEMFASIMTKLNDLVWGVPMIVLLFGTHIFMTFRTKGIQRYLIKGIKLSITKDDDGDDDGNVCHLLVYVQRGVLDLYDYEQRILTYFDVDNQQSSRYHRSEKRAQSYARKA